MRAPTFTIDTISESEISTRAFARFQKLNYFDIKKLFDRGQSEIFILAAFVFRSPVVFALKVSAVLFVVYFVMVFVDLCALLLKENVRTCTEFNFRADQKFNKIISIFFRRLYSVSH